MATVLSVFVGGLLLRNSEWVEVKTTSDGWDELCSDGMRVTKVVCRFA